MKPSRRPSLSLVVSATTLLLLSPLTPGCTFDATGHDEEPGAPRVPSIVNGQPDNGHPSVGMLRTYPAKFSCTATLVGKRTVLTAGHCAADPLQYAVVFQGVEYPVIKKEVNPAYLPLHGKSTFSINDSAKDIAVLILQFAPPIPPTPVAAIPPPAGAGLTLVGFGITGNGQQDSGVKRVAQSRVAEVVGDALVWGQQGAGLGNTCSGDSGGPQLWQLGNQEAQVSVTSAGNCVNRGFGPRVDRFMSWIKAVSGGDVVVAGGNGQVPPPPPPPPQLKGYGQPCQDHGECSSFLCASRPDGSTYCTVDCDWGKPCPQGQTCFPTQFQGLQICGAVANGGGQQPSPPPPPPPPPGGNKPFMASCNDQAECQSSVCVTSYYGGAYCSYACGPGTLCPVGFFCVPTEPSGFNVCAYF